MTDCHFRQGIGYDVHELVEYRKLILGGVEIPFERGLLGHSDADVLIHAIMDALCGALCLGDIGKLFPDTDPQYRGISSRILLSRVVELMEERGYELVNCDSIVCCQRPRLAPYIPEMRKRLSQDLHAEEDRVSVKATTTEHLGFVGEEKGLESFATVLLTKRNS